MSFGFTNRKTARAESWDGAGQEKSTKQKMFLGPLLTLNKLDGPLGHVSRRVPIFRVRRSINLAPVLATIGALGVRILIDEEAVFVPPLPSPTASGAPMLAP